MADAFYLATAIAAGTGAVGLAAGWTGNHTREIAASWHEGTAQVSAWCEFARSVWQAVCRIAPTVAAAVVLWLLAAALPAHGVHRAPLAHHIFPKPSGGTR